MTCSIGPFALSIQAVKTQFNTGWRRSSYLDNPDHMFSNLFANIFCEIHHLRNDFPPLVRGAVFFANFVHSEARFYIHWSNSRWRGGIIQHCSDFLIRLPLYTNDCSVLSAFSLLMEDVEHNCESTWENLPSHNSIRPFVFVQWTPSSLWKRAEMNETNFSKPSQAKKYYGPTMHHTPIVDDSCHTRPQLDDQLIIRTPQAPL